MSVLVRPDWIDLDVCGICLRPVATDADYDRYQDGEGEHLCWSGPGCQKPEVSLLEQARAWIRHLEAESADLRTRLDG